jgi:hypothetical protein
MKHESSFKLATSKVNGRERRSSASSTSGKDRLFLFSPKGDVDALSSEQLVLVLDARDVAWSADDGKEALKTLVRRTTPTDSESASQIVVTKSKKKLLILDINGLLVDRPSFISRQKGGSSKDQASDLVTRPFLDEFLQLIITELRYDVTVWTAGFIDPVYVCFFVCFTAPSSIPAPYL